MADDDSGWHTAAAESLSAWGMARAEIELVSRSENLVYRVDADAATYGLRVHRPGYHTRRELLSEQQWIAALADAGCSVPTPRPTLSGAGLGTVTAAGEAPRSASLVRWVAGDLVGSRLANARRDDRLALLREIGAANARLHAAAAGWIPPAGFSRVQWDADGLMGDDPVWGRFWEVRGLGEDQVQLLLRTRDRLRERLERLAVTAEHYGLIHADMHPYNMVLSDAGIHVIDFDDAGFGWHGYDVAVALYNFRRDPDFPAIRAAFADGYRSVRPFGLSPEQLDSWFVVRSLVWLGWVGARPDLGGSKRLAQAIDLVCGEADEYEHRSQEHGID